MTDNKNRTTSEIQNIFNKNGGNMAQMGAVAYQFQQLGRIIVAREGKSVDDIFLEAADAGALDVEEADNEVFIYTKPSDLAKVRKSLLDKSFTVKETELIRKPLTPTEIANEEIIQKVIAFLDKLEEYDDVQKVYSNFEIQ